MKFNYKECTAQDVANIKKLYKQQSNNPKITKKYTDILEDTKTAIKNLNSCITSQEKLRTIMKLIQQENTSFMKNIIGVNEKGNNNSYYRGFLSLDEKNVLEIRIANHYETENSAKDKSNNVSQFLFQVVLKTTPPKNQTTDSITKNKKVANLNIITKTLKTNSTIEEVCSLLKCISDFLISPSDDYANNEQTTIKDTNSINNKQINCNINMKTNKKTIRLTESDLHNIIKESVKKVLNESYGYDAYSQSGYEKCCKIGEGCAYNAMKELISTYDEYNLDNECISRTINAFESQLWLLADIGYEDEDRYKNIKGLGIKKPQYN